MPYSNPFYGTDSIVKLEKSSLGTAVSTDPHVTHVGLCTLYSCQSICLACSTVREFDLFCAIQLYRMACAPGMAAQPDHDPDDEVASRKVSYLAGR